MGTLMNEIGAYAISFSIIALAVSSIITTRRISMAQASLETMNAALIRDNEKLKAALAKFEGKDTVTK
jgi:hypothetical protein